MIIRNYFDINNTVIITKKRVVQKADGKFHGTTIITTTTTITNTNTITKLKVAKTLTTLPLSRITSRRSCSCQARRRLPSYQRQRLQGLAYKQTDYVRTSYVESTLRWSSHGPLTRRCNNWAGLTDLTRYQLRSTISLSALYLVKGDSRLL